MLSIYALGQVGFFLGETLVRALTRTANPIALMLGEAGTPNARINAAGTQSVSRVKLGVLAPGAYRITLAGETAAGPPAKIDERTYWFDGKAFEGRNNIVAMLESDQSRALVNGGSAHVISLG